MCKATPIPGEVLDHFEIQEDGSVFYKKTGKPLKGSFTSAGYMRACYNGKLYYVHRLVATKFLPNPNNLPQINHKNMDKSDNRVENLEWCDNGHNVRHSIENNHNRNFTTPGNSRKSVLTEEQVLWVLENLGTKSQRSMAKELGVDGRVIYHIKNGITHSNITKIERTDCGGFAHGKEVLWK